MTPVTGERRYWEITESRREEACSKGILHRHFFPHGLRYLPKCGPDGMRLAHLMCGIDDPGSCWQVVLNASRAVVDRFPPGLFFDDGLLWHRQQFGCDGHVASANIAVRDGSAYTMAHFSDVVQRSARKPDCRTLINKLFRGWHLMLLNAIGHFCLHRGIERCYIPTSKLSMAFTDKDRQVQPQLFSRLYDDDVQRRFMVERRGDWWCVDVKANALQFLIPEQRTEAPADEKIICVCHDIEYGMGHTEVDPGFAREADERAPAHIDTMLKMEADAGINATYNVVGKLFPGVRNAIESGGHCLGFHSYDHRIESTQRRQLWMCESVDYRVKGYRPPQSRVTEDLNDYNLAFYNFDWLASGARSLGTRVPELRNGLSRIPIRFDDFAMYRHAQPYEQWEEWAFSHLGGQRFVAFSLHDCYADFWLPHYPDLLSKIGEMGTLMTLDEVAERLALANAV